MTDLKTCIKNMQYIATEMEDLTYQLDSLIDDFRMIEEEKLPLFKRSMLASKTFRDRSQTQLEYFYG